MPLQNCQNNMKQNSYQLPTKSINMPNPTFCKSMCNTHVKSSSKYKKSEHNHSLQNPVLAYRVHHKQKPQLL